ncbi:hypothetical protein GCM10027290_15730 [Micromonospora sonneratiae]
MSGLAGYGKTSFLNARFCRLAPNESVQFVLVDGKGGPDYGDLSARTWIRRISESIDEIDVDRPFWVDDEGQAATAGGKWIDAVELRQAQSVHRPRRRHRAGRRSMLPETTRRRAMVQTCLTSSA